MTQQQPPVPTPVQLTVDDMTALIQTDETSRLKVQGIALQRRVNELEEQNATLKEENATLKAQIAEPDTATSTNTNNKNDSKLTAVAGD
jgi:regulator of replication initiation timing